MHKSKIFFWLSLSFIAGIFCASFYYPQIAGDFWFFLILIGTLIILFVFYRNKNVILCSFCVLIFLGGLWVTSNKLKTIVQLDKQRRYFSGEVMIVKEPAVKDRTQKMVVRNEKGEKFLVMTDPYGTYAYGDRLRLDCDLEMPQGMDGFDYQMHLAKETIFYLCKKPIIEKLSSGKGNYGYRLILKIKNGIEEKIDHVLPAPQSGLLTGLLLGGDDKLSQEMQDNFSKTGLTHIVAVSGYNVTIVAEYLMLLGIFLGLWRRQAFWLAITGIFLFVILVGFPASAVRAGVMGTLILWATKNGRLANAQNSILFASIAMMLFNPLLLRWDVGFQLSFLATLGIVYFYPLIEKYSIKKQGISFFSEILFLTLSAQIFVLPIILNNFQKLPILSPLANLLVLPIIPLTMLLGFLMIVFSFVFKPLAVIFSWIVYLPLKYETWMVEHIANLKYSSLEVANFSWAWVVVWYIIIAGAIYKLKNLRVYGGRE